MPAIRIKTEPKRPSKPLPTVAEDDGLRSTFGRRLKQAGEFVSGRYGERKEQRRTRAPRNMVGRRG